MVHSNSEHPLWYQGTWKGEKFHSLRGLGRLCGFDPKTLRRIMQALGCDAATAADVAVADGDGSWRPGLAKPLTFRGVEYPSEAAMLDAYGVTKPTFRRYKAKCGSSQEALEAALAAAAAREDAKRRREAEREERKRRPRRPGATKPDGWSPSNAVDCVVDGVEYASRNKAAIANGVSPRAVRGRCERGATVEEAIHAIKAGKTAAARKPKSEAKPHPRRDRRPAPVNFARKPKTPPPPGFSREEREAIDRAEAEGRVQRIEPSHWPDPERHNKRPKSRCRYAGRQAAKSAYARRSKV